MPRLPFPSVFAVAFLMSAAIASAAEELPAKAGPTSVQARPSRQIGVQRRSLRPASNRTLSRNNCLARTYSPRARAILPSPRIAYPTSCKSSR